MSEQEIRRYRTIPYDGDPFTALVGMDGQAIPFEFRGWKTEVDSWVKTAYLGAAISDQWYPYEIKGAGAKDFMKKYFVNNFDKAPIGKSKHGLMLNERGTIVGDGIILVTGEEDYVTTCCWPTIEYYLDREHEQDNFKDVEGINQMDTCVLYQIGGPKSLEILERATNEDLHGLEYLHFENHDIACHTVRILRMGMAGTLSYEVHCDMADCLDVYRAIWEAGQDYGMVKLGYHAYMMNHTENGFEQACLHFAYDYTGMDDMRKWEEENCPFLLGLMDDPVSRGSEQDVDKAFHVNPFDIGWGYLVNFKHDFVGKEACLAKKGKGNHLECVTLEWNAEDVGDVYASQFAGGEPYMPMDDVNDYLQFDFLAAQNLMHADKVMADGKQVGISSGRGQIWHYHRMISLCSIDPAYAEEGTEVTVIWGAPGYPQKEIRAKVARFPYLKAPKNADFDVSQVPHGNR